MNGFNKARKEIRKSVKDMSHLYQNGEIDEDLYMLFVRMAMAQEISLGIEDKIEKKLLKNRFTVKLSENF